MIGNLVKKLVGTSNDRLVKRLRKDVDSINDFEAGLAARSDEDLLAATHQFRQRLADGAELESLLPEAFAVVREASRRTLGLRHFDVQMIGGSVLHDGKIAEMRTGEGKTLVATTAVYLNALSGKGVHVVTVNDYLAQRDAEWMSGIYEFLGMSVGVIISNLSSDERRQAYAADVTYGTNNEFGFDYLRDNMAHSSAQKVQRGLHFAIVDEVDSILIDEARTPLIISGPTDSDSEMYARVNTLIPQLERQQEEEGPGDYSVDEKGKQVHLTEQGHDRVEELLLEQEILQEGESLYDPAHIMLMHHLNAALRAHAIYQKDIAYIVKDDQIIIVDEFTGRTMPGRRWSEGLHQAIEAKEGVTIQQENQTLASITFQNYFRLYEKLAGMTGTADTEAFELQQIYTLEVVVIPTHRDMIRDDKPDLVYLTQREKYDAIIADIEQCVARMQPVPVGTTSIETSEYLAGLLQQKDIDHEVLNAKQHEREAHIIANAGMPAAVTIATNMAGRGTDIVLGGNLDAELAAIDDDDKESREQASAGWNVRHESVLKSGGLHIIGTERHESRRIDNQLRGRSGRQGDPGSSRFYLSLEDSLMRIFASERVGSIMQKLGMEEGEAIEHPWVTKAIENAQRKVEGHNFDIRKNVLDYDDVANEQRKVVYEQRNELMQAESVKETVDDMRHVVITAMATSFIPPGSIDDLWDLPSLEQALQELTGETIDVQSWLAQEPDIPEADIHTRLITTLEQAYVEKEQAAGSEGLRQFEKYIVLKALDEHWKEHLAGMDYLRQSIGLRGYAQKNPKQEYKREAYDLFTRMLGEYNSDVVGILSKVRVQDPQQVQEAVARRPVEVEVSYEHGDVVSPLAEEVADAATAAPAVAAVAATGAVSARTSPRPPPQAQTQPYVRGEKKLGRNDPCHCGSGKKFKHCHGKISQGHSE